MLNSIRPHTLTSLLTDGEVRNRKLTREGQGDSGNLSHVETVSVRTGVYGVVGDGMAGSWGDVNEGSRGRVSSGGVHDLRSRSEEPHPERDRASVGAKKRGNARGAKGGRDMEAAEVPWPGQKKTDVVPASRAVRVRDVCPPGWCTSSGLPLNVSRSAEATLRDNALIQRSGGRS
jgi:hypothetical protein